VLLVGVPLMWLGASRVDRDCALPDGGANTAAAVPQESQPFVFYSLALAFGLLAVVHGVALHHLIPLLHERQLDVEYAVLAASFIGPMQVAGRVIMMTLEKRVANRTVTSACFIAMGVSIACLILVARHPLLLIFFVFFFGSGYGVVSIVRPVIARDLLGQHNFGAKSGTLALFFLAGVAVAPWVGSIIWRFGGYELVLLVLLLIALAGLILYRLADFLATR